MVVVVVVGGAVTEGEVEEMGEEEESETSAVGRQEQSDFQLLPTHT